LGERYRGEEVWGGRGELEEVVCFAAHDDEGLFLGGGEVRGGGDCVEEAVQAGVVFVGGCVAGCGDDADFDVFAVEVCGGGG
jgi:hypothetical protein